MQIGVIVDWALAAFDFFNVGQTFLVELDVVVAVAVCIDGSPKAGDKKGIA